MGPLFRKKTPTKQPNRSWESAHVSSHFCCSSLNPSYFFFRQEINDWDKMTVTCVRCDISLTCRMPSKHSLHCEQWHKNTEGLGGFFFKVCSKRQLSKMYRSLFCMGIITLELNNLQNLLKVRIMSLILIFLTATYVLSPVPFGRPAVFCLFCQRLWKAARVCWARYYPCKLKK